MNVLLAMTQDEAIAAIRRQVGDGGGGAELSAYVWMAMVALALSAILLIIRWRRGQVTRGAALNDAAKLAREIRREAGISRAQVKQLKRQAVSVERRTGVKVKSPMVIVLCPSLTRKRVAQEARVTPSTVAP